MPGLDGLRAIAVLAVIAYHLGFSWAPGGLLGVGVFFTLSGYLITDLLLAQLYRRGNIRLVEFWLGRARRLLPALFVMLAVVAAWVTAIGPSQPPQFRDAAAAAVLYVSNWQLIFEDISYFALFAAPSPLNHLWSLAVEEQFYILWPFVLVAGVVFVKEVTDRPSVRPRLAAVTAGLALASALTMILLYEPSLDPSRVYYGTDTRAGELLAGAALAMVWPSRVLRTNVPPGARWVLDGMGVVGLIVIFILFWRTTEFSPFLYRGGFLLLSISTVLVVAALAHPACRLGVLLGCAPLRWIGVRSYGIYLWHFPIIVLTTPAGEHGTDLVRDALQVTAIFAVAALSWKYVEEPVRRGALGRLWRWLKENRWRPEAIPRPAWVAVGASFLVLATAGAGLAGVNSAPPLKAGALGAEVDIAASETAAATTSKQTALTPCRSVIHIGDSTSEGLNSPDYLPDPRDRIGARYARAGARDQHLEISGARSIVETFEGEANAYDVALAWKAEGYRGCWVLALGTNDSANTFVGPGTDEQDRIERMMLAIGDQPVLWTTVKSLLTDGPYADENMQSWNEALLEACDRHPNMRVFDWASAVRDHWFIEDGIHFTSTGYAARSRMIAQALADAFPGPDSDSADQSGCVVR